MSLRRFRISDSGNLVTEHGKLDSVDFGTSTFDWLDLETESNERVREILAEIGVDSRIIEECLHQHRYSRFLNVHDTIFFEFPIINTGNEGHYDFVSFICMPRCLVTIRHHHVTPLDDVLDSQIRLVSPDKAALLFQLLEDVMRDNVTTALRVRERIDRLAADADERTEMIEAAEILSLKRRLFRYISIFDDQMYCLAFLRQADSPAFDLGSVRNHFRDLLKGMDHVIRMMNRLERRLEYAQQHCTLLLQEKTNSRMKILTVVAAVFLPLSLIAGIYGMNFRAMPELDYPYAYYATLSAMAAVAGGLLLFFYWRGWFR